MTVSMILSAVQHSTDLWNHSLAVCSTDQVLTWQHLETALTVECSLAVLDTGHTKTF